MQEYETQPGIEDLPAIKPKTMKTILWAAILLIILVSIGYNGYIVSNKITESFYQKGLTAGRQQVNDQMIQQIIATGEISATIYDNDGAAKVIILKVAEIR